MCRTKRKAHSPRKALMDEKKNPVTLRKFSEVSANLQTVKEK